MVRNKPNKRRAMMNMTPMMTALPNAWNVSASGQPHDSFTHVAIAVDSSQSSMSSLLYPSDSPMAGDYIPLLSASLFKHHIPANAALKTTKETASTSKSKSVLGEIRAYTIGYPSVSHIGQ